MHLTPHLSPPVVLLNGVSEFYPFPPAKKGSDGHGMVSFHTDVVADKVPVDAVPTTLLLVVQQVAGWLLWLLVVLVYLTT